MKILDTVLLILLVLPAAIACTGESATATPVPTATPQPLEAAELACRDDTCIRRVFLRWVSDKEIVLEFDLVDSDGKVEVGSAPSIEEDINLGLFAKDDTYLLGGLAPAQAISCYAGNDISWSEGRLAASCQVSLPANEMQIRPNLGDEIRVKVIEFRFEETTTLSE